MHLCPTSHCCTVCNGLSCLTDCLLLHSSRPGQGSGPKGIRGDMPLLRVQGCGTCCVQKRRQERRVWQIPPLSPSLHRWLSRGVCIISRSPTKTVGCIRNLRAAPERWAGIFFLVEHFQWMQLYFLYHVFWFIPSRMACMLLFALLCPTETG